jgi:2,5-dioxopentanoate dehydrogenase
MIFTSQIGFQQTEENEDVFSTFNCLLNEKNEEQFCTATVQEVQQAAKLAWEAFTVYRKTSSEKRIQFIHAIADKLDQRRDELIAMYCKESSLSISRAESELNRTLFQLKDYSNYLKNEQWNQPITSFSNDHLLNISSQFHPIGPVVVFGSSNFPFAYSTAGGDTAGALAAGCPVIVKAHPMHAGTSCLVAECILEAAKEHNMPDGVFSHLLDNKYAIATELVTNDWIRAVAFTGSIKGGRALMDLAAKRTSPIPVFAEMGSINPVVFFESELEKNTELWADKFTSSIATDAGQFCTKPGLLFVPKSHWGDEFIQLLKLQLSQVNPTCHLHPQLFSNFKEKVSEVFDWNETKLPFHSQPIVRVVTYNDFINDYRLQEEYFGPQAIAVSYASFEELTDMLQKLEGQLTATIIGSNEDAKEHPDVLDLLQERAGRIIFNGVPTGVTVCDAMVHGGVYPSSSDSRFTAVGSRSIYRFLRPIAFQRLAERQ